MPACLPCFVLPARLPAPLPPPQVSNAGFTEAEFESWQRALKEQGRPQVSRRVAKDAYERLVKANT
jgi:hypothetical protein